MRILEGYDKKWCCLSFVLGAIGGSLSFVIHGLIIFPQQSFGTHFFFELFTLIGAALILATVTFLPLSFLSDLFLKKSSRGIYLMGIMGAILLASIILRNRFEFSVEFFSFGWNVYFYALIMGVLSAFGWSKSKIEVIKSDSLHFDK